MFEFHYFTTITDHFHFFLFLSIIYIYIYIYTIGLAGLPFAGKSGFGAYLHHVPDEGKLLVVFAPHVGVDAEGKIGGLQRDGQVKVSNACGAAIGAYKALQAKKVTPTDPLLVLETLQKENIETKFDPQLEQIVQKLAPRLKGIEDSTDSISFVTYQMYGIVRELITSIITQTDDVFDYATEVAVVGGVSTTANSNIQGHTVLFFLQRDFQNDMINITMVHRIVS